MEPGRLVAGICLVLAAWSCSDTGDPDGSTGLIDAGSPTLFRNALVSMRGAPVVVNYWATWCTPCKQEMPRLVDAAEKYQGRVAFLGVNVKDDTEIANRFLETYRVPFRSLADTDEAIRQEQRILGLPVTQFYDADGELAFVHQGEITTEDLEEKIEEVLRLSRSARTPGPG